MKKMILAFAALCLILGGCGAKDAYTGTASDGTGDGTEESICFSAAEAVEEPSGTEDEEEAFLFVMKDGDDLIAIGCEYGQVSAVDNVTFAPGSAINWTPTITAMGDNGFTLITEEAAAG